ncbi:MAG: sulfite exporter TauE/SafE family protein [Actinomycetota bacterium]|nr:sulfite exporter TauE/SafE family protein [Actinomycetota bacterium]
MIEVFGFALLGLITGVIASTMGIGGGIIFVPSLVVFFGFEQHIAQGTSLAIIVPTAIVGTILHAKKGRVDWRVAALIASGGIVGGLLGSRAALALDPLLLRRLFAGLLVIIAIRMLSSSPRRQSAD